MKRNYFFCLSTIFLITFSACKKVDFETNSMVNVKLTDAPYDAQEVNVDIVDVLVKVENDNLEWRSIKLNPGIYNLLAFQNGKDTLIASGSIHATSIIKELKLVLGDRNTIKIENTLFPLSIPAGSDGGLIVIVDQKLNKDVYNFLIDFDAAQSVFPGVTGGYLLKPFLRLK